MQFRLSNPRPTAQRATRCSRRWLQCFTGWKRPRVLAAGGTLVLGALACDGGTPTSLASRMGSARREFASTAAVPWTDLGTLGGSSSVATGINDRGEVVGTSETTTGVSHSFIWTRSSGIQDLSPRVGEAAWVRSINDRGDMAGFDNRGVVVWTRTGDDEALGFFGEARSLNARGEVAGMRRFGHGMRPFFWSPRTGPVDVGFPSLGASLWAGYALSVNDRSEVVGFSLLSLSDSEYGGQLYHYGAFFWSARTGTRQLFPPDGVTPLETNDPVIAWFINNRGDAFGSVLDDGRRLHLVRWNRDGGASDLYALPVAAGGFLQVLGGNDRGDVVGIYTNETSVRAFAWSERSGFVNLGWDAGESYAEGINNSGQVIGFVMPSLNGPARARIWDIDGVGPREVDAR